MLDFSENISMMYYTQIIYISEEEDTNRTYPRFRQ